MSEERSKYQAPPERPGRRIGVFGGGHRPLGMPVEKAKNFKGSLKRLISYLKPRQLQLILVFLAAIISTIFSIVTPKIMGQATTKLFEGLIMKAKGIPGAHVDFEYIWRIILSLGVLYLISACFSYLQQWIMAGVSEKTVAEMRQAVNEKLSRLPLKFFDARTHGEISSRVTNDLDNIGSTLQQSLTQLITAIVTLVGVIVMMLTISFWLTLTCLVTLPLIVITTKMIASRSQKFFVGQQKALGELNGHIEENYTGHQIVKAFGREAKAVLTFNEINEELYQFGWRAQFFSSILMPLMIFINNLGYVLICVIGGIFVIQKRIQIGDIQAFIQYSRQFTQPINQTANIANILQSTIASAERVFELLDETEEIPESINAQNFTLPVGEIHFEQVTFGYQTDHPLFENLNLAVKKGQTVAIVGPTGAGKTTLVNLLMRFYELDGGKITVDGTEITQVKRGDLREIFGMVLQDTWLFHDTIQANIAYGHEAATEAEIIQAAKAAHADHFIRTLPDGYQTVINEEGSNLSQGQKQLLTIARALLANPEILILDEATSSVDTRTEILIQQAMQTLMKNRTSFVIAHRLSTIRNADLILVMNQGKIIETGTHQTLLTQDGFYAELYNSQFTVGMTA